MKIIITEKQNILLTESSLRGYLNGVEYIPGKTISYDYIRRIGTYLENKDIINMIIAREVNNDLGHYRKNFDEDGIREFIIDVLREVSDNILDYYESNWSSEITDDDLIEKFRQIYDFLFETYSDIIYNYIYDNYM